MSYVISETITTPSKVEQIHKSVGETFDKHKQCIMKTTAVLGLLAYGAYFTYAVYLKGLDNIALMVLTILGVLLLVYSAVKDKVVLLIKTRTPLGRWIHNVQQNRRFTLLLPWAIYLILVVVILALTIPEIIKEPVKARSLGGLFLLVFLCFLVSKDHSKVNWHLVIRSVLSQFVLGLLVLRWRDGARAVEWLGNQMSLFLSYRLAGSSYVYGSEESAHPFFMTNLTVVFYFGCVYNILNYMGLVEGMVKKTGWLISMVTGATPALSFISAANIFLGGPQVGTTIQPLLQKMTNSEIHTVFVCGFASVSGAIMAIFMSFGIPAEYLLAASLMSAPAALAIGNIMYPEVEDTQLPDGKSIKFPPCKEQSLVEAAVNGATIFGSLYFSIVAPIIGFFSSVTFINATISWLGARIGQPRLTLQLIFSYVFYPLTFMMGVDGRDLLLCGEVIGVSIFVNGALANRMLADLIQNRQEGKQPAFSSTRTEVISSYALCKFANVTGLAVQLGAMMALCPQKKDVMPSLALRALIGGNVAAFMTACIAGLLYVS